MNIEPKALGKALKSVLHAAKGTEERHAYIWLQAGPRETFCRVVATDNYRLAIASVPFEGVGTEREFAIHRDDVTALLHFLARARAPMRVLPWEENKVMFQDIDSALVLTSSATAKAPDWRKVTEQEWSQQVQVNLAHIGEAATAAGETGYLKVTAEWGEKPMAFVTQDYAEYVMPMRQPAKGYEEPQFEGRPK